MGKILVVDDEAEIRKLLAKTLKKVEHKVLVAEKGKQAIKIVQREKPDVVLLDLKLPDMNGHSVLKKIRQTNGTTGVIIITGYGTMKSVKESLQQGALDYIAKPFSIKRIRKIVNNALKKNESLKKSAKQEDKFKKKCRKIIRENHILVKTR